MNCILLFSAGIISGILGAMGLGGGGILILYLVFIEKLPQFEAQGINLIFFIPCAISAIAVYTFKKQIDYKSLLPIIIAGIVGAFGGIWLSQRLGTAIVAKLFGAGLVIMGIGTFFQKSEENDKNK